MSDQNTPAAFAKLAGILKALEAALSEKNSRSELPIQNFSIDDVFHYFKGAATQISILSEAIPDLFGDFPIIKQTHR